ncbi:hypothetical protein L915_04227, partial [Phytophthora nicotianae]
HDNRTIIRRAKGNGKAKAIASKVNLTRDDYRILVSWIEVETNFMGPLESPPLV